MMARGGNFLRRNAGGFSIRPDGRAGFGRSGVLHLAAGINGKPAADGGAETFSPAAREEDQPLTGKRQVRFPATLSRHAVA